MPCHAAIAEKSLVLTSDIKIEKALKDMKKKGAEFCAVTDADGILVGVLSEQIILKNLLPVSVAMSDGLQLDVKLPAAPGIAKRLKKITPLNVEELMERKNFPVVHPETPIWEGVNMLAQSGLPLVVVDPQTQKYIGLISFQSALDELYRLRDSEA